MSGILDQLDLGTQLDRLAYDQAEWSRATFGSDQEKGPLGALKHLEKEAREAQASPDDHSEYADCFLLVLDASRRAGLGPLQLIAEARKKMAVNRTREWVRPADPDQPVEHKR